MPPENAVFSLLLVVTSCGVLTAQPPANVPPELVAMLQKARSLVGQQQFSEAEQLLEDATKKFQERPAAWYLLGYAHHAQKEYDKAMKAYERALALSNGKAPGTLYNMACLHALRGETDQAFERLDEAIAAGFQDFVQLQSDADLSNLKLDPRFQTYQPKWLSDDELFVEPTRIIP